MSVRPSQLALFYVLLPRLCRHDDDLNALDYIAHFQLPELGSCLESIQDGHRHIHEDDADGIWISLRLDHLVHGLPAVLGLFKMYQGVAETYFECHNVEGDVVY